MALAQSITGLLNRKPQKTLLGKEDEDPIVTLATELRKPVDQVRTAVERLRDNDELWVRSQARGGKLPAIGLSSRKGSTRKQHHQKYGPECGESADEVITDEADTEAGAPAPEETTDEGDQLVEERSAEVVDEVLAPHAPPPPSPSRPSLSGHMPKYLTLVLRGFQDNAIACEACNSSHADYGVHGRLEAGSCVDLVKLILPWVLTPQAYELNRWLGNLGLRFTITLREDVYRHFVRLDVSEVTAEMMKEWVPPGAHSQVTAPLTDPEREELEALRKEVKGLRVQVAELRTVKMQLATASVQIASLRRRIAPQAVALTTELVEKKAAPTQADPGEISLYDLQRELLKGSE